MPPNPEGAGVEEGAGAREGEEEEEDKRQNFSFFNFSVDHHTVNQIEFLGCDGSEHLAFTTSTHPRTIGA